MKPLVWLHGASLSATDPALLAYPQAPGIFVFDTDFLSHNRIAFARLQFVFEAATEALAGREHRVALGNQATEILAFATSLGRDSIHTTEVFSPEQERTLDALEAAGMAVYMHDREQWIRCSGKLKRFSGFWKQVEQQVWR
jgi:deoxyribodipyrimidine photo-lyase